MLVNHGSELYALQNFMGYHLSHDQTNHAAESILQHADLPCQYWQLPERHHLLLWPYQNRCPWPILAVYQLCHENPPMERVEVYAPRLIVPAMHVEVNLFRTHVHNYPDALRHWCGFNPSVEWGCIFHQFPWTLLPCLGISELEKAIINLSATLANI